MFDTIVFEMRCPICKAKVNDFQSKDGPCLLENLSPYDVSNFYSPCPNCNAWIEFNRKLRDANVRVPLKKILKEFTMEVRKRKKSF